MTELEHPTHYPNVLAFVNQYLRYVYQRQVTDTTDAVWCPEWWKHSEAVIRLDALWRAWENLRRDPGKGLSLWFLDHADKHMAKLLDPNGPFKYCSARHGHRDLLTALPLRTPPTGMFSEESGDVIYKSVVEFVENYLSMTYPRQVTDTTDTVWCPEWWKHPEAGARLDSLWRVWEQLRKQGATGLSEWFVDYADPQMQQLFDARGTFRYCNARHGHKDLLTPLPSGDPGAEMFSNPEGIEKYQV
ncbi:DUF4913 domain-containing protein [Nocardia macrotermitis]|uniref:DUF4913 domain-containing protein n=1 Tax=Nocardia macrotermitis TaxID=2585198 RepID=A0A7K0D8K0_9NOCA|nr:DUF4913 domain-containing protein [Nocardia macrotermitis]MQY21919.1 hypothetical protein [Nocardia macrotermitis]